jgi:hypothetical protein
MTPWGGGCLEPLPATLVVSCPLDIDGLPPGTKRQRISVNEMCLRETQRDVRLKKLLVRLMVYYEQMKLTPSQLRANIYRILDEVLETGKPVEIHRNGRTLQIIADAPQKSGKLKNLKRRTGVLDCDFDEIVHIDWSSEWRP